MFNTRPIDFNEAGQGVMLRPLQKYFEDPHVSEILINKPCEAYIEKYGEMTRISIPEMTRSYLNDLFKVVAKSNHQIINAKNPLFYGSLQDSSRITLVVPPTAKDYTLSIRRKIVNNIPLEKYRDDNYYSDMKPLINLDNDLELLSSVDLELIKQYKNLIAKFGKCSKEEYSQLSHEFIISAVRARKNIVFSGGTSSGKTTFLNACIKAMHEDDRIITLEDTREIDITNQHNFVSLLAKSKGGGEEESPIEMKDLVKACLRLKPDRIIMGEIRSGEIMDFVRASNTGHNGSITTVHADNPRMAFKAMASMYKHNNIVMSDSEIMDDLKSTIDLVVQLNKKEKGLRQASMIYYKHGNLHKGDNDYGINK
jgi:type IV secretion system protein VirB11